MNIFSYGKGLLKGLKATLYALKSINYHVLQINTSEIKISEVQAQ